MRISEFISVERNYVAEHSDWARDPYYTPERERAILNAVLASQNYYASKGITLKINDQHFFQQLFANRGMSRIEPEMLIRAFAKIMNRGLHLFQGKNEGTSFIFYDPETNINIPFVKVKKQIYRIPTIARDTKWLGPGDKINLH